MSLKKKLYLLSFIPLAFLAIGVISILYSISSINKKTEDYLNSYTKKNEKIQTVLNSFGYGGGIHHFKNYVIRHKDSYRELAIKSFNKSLSEIEQYRRMGYVSGEEIKSLSTIYDTIKNYKENLALTKASIEQNKDTKLIDEYVKIDDNPALISISTLQEVLLKEKSEHLSKISSSYNAIRYLSICLIILSILIGILLNILFSKKILSSLNVILDMTNKIEENSYDLEGFKLSSVEEGEIKKIGHSMKEMSSNIQNYISELEQTNSDLTDYAFLASHDLQEPIKKVSNYLGLISLELKGNENYAIHNYIDQAIKSSERMVKTIDSLLDYSLILARDYNFELVTLNSIINNTKLNLHHMIDDSLHINYPECVTFIANKDLMITLFENLVKNSIMFHKENDNIFIDITCDSDHDNSIIFSYKDNSQGFDLTNISTVLRPFGKLSNKKDESLGMGLAMCKKILLIHESDIKIETAPGLGVTIQFKLKKSDDLID